MYGRLIRLLEESIPFLKKALLRRRYPGLGVHYTAEIQVDGRLDYGIGASIGAQAKLLVPAGAQVSLGDGAYIGRDVELGPIGCITIGDRASLQDRCIIVGDVDIGRYCLLSFNILISSGSHYFRDNPHLLIRDQDEAVQSDPVRSSQHSAPVRIGEDCWLGINTVVMPGVQIGRGSIVGANSVVSHDVPPYSIVAGAPAKRIGSRLDFAPPLKIDSSNLQDMPYFYSGFELAADQREKNAVSGGYVAKSAFELWLDGSGTTQVVKIRGLGKGETVVRLHEDQSWEIGNSWIELRFASRPGPIKFEADNQGVAVSAAWVE